MIDYITFRSVQNRSKSIQNPKNYEKTKMSCQNINHNIPETFFLLYTFITL